MFYDLKAFSFLLFMSMKWRYHCLYTWAFEAAYEQIYVQAVFQHIGVQLVVSSLSPLVQVVAMDKGMLTVCVHEGRSERLCWGSLINVCIDVKGEQSREPELCKSVLGLISHFKVLF